MISSKAAYTPHGNDSGLPHWRPAAARLKKKSGYVLSDLLRFDDADFIDVAYRTLLGRPADSAGRDCYLAALRGGRTSKVEILGLIRFSDEGRKHGIHVDGLLLPYKLHQWRHRRAIGPILGFAMAVLRLPRLAWRLQSMEANAAHEAQHMGEALNCLSLEVEQRLAGMETTLRETIGAVVETSFVEFGRSFIGTRAAQTCLLDKEVQGLPDERPAHPPRYTPIVEPVAFKRAMFGEIVRQHGGDEAGQLAAASLTRSTLEISPEVNIAASVIADAIDRFGMDFATRAAATDNALQSRLAQVSAEWHKKLAGRTAATESGLQSRLTQVSAEWHKKLADRTAATESGLQSRLTQISTDLYDRLADRTAALRALEARIEEQGSSHEEAHDQAKRSIGTLEQDQLATRRDVLHTQMRLDRLSNASQDSSAPSQAATQGTSDGDFHALDSFYVAFENEFRGSRELVAQRAEVYLPIVVAALAHTGGGAVLDIGCGRGEWLGLLGQHNLEARGIELNEVNVIDCRARGLDVQQAEAVVHLRTLGEATLGAVTGMHIVEHIPFPALVALFDEIRRVLKPGGVVVFETPNPENLTVSTCDFYLDPTHRHPLPPPLLEYTAKARGFEQVEIRRLSEHRPASAVPVVAEPGQPNAPMIDWLLQRSREHLGAAPDYAVIAWKSAANHRPRPDSKVPGWG